MGVALDLTTILILLAVLWFFGGAIKKILSGAGEMAGDEFEQMRADQITRMMNQDIKRTAELNKLKDKSFLSASEIIANYNKTKAGE